MRIKIARGAYMILYPGLATPYDAVSIAVSAGSKVILIDTGSGAPASNMQLFNGIIEAGMDPRRVEWVFNTHAHVHNAGGDRWVKDMLHAMIAAHVPDSRIIEEGDNQASDAARLGLTLKPTPVSLHVEGDMMIDVEGLKVMLMHTPGHTPGSMSIIVDLDQRVAVVGDALGSLSKRWGSSEEDWWDSLSRIKDERPQVLCTSIRCYAGESVREAIMKVEREGPVWVD